MQMKGLLKELSKDNWIKYLERKQPFFLFAFMIKDYGELLEKETGFGWEEFCPRVGDIPK